MADHEATLATHDVSHGGLAVTLAEMVTDEAGADVDVASPAALFDEQPGRVVVETTDPAAVREAFEDVAPVSELGAATGTGRLNIAAGGETLRVEAEAIAGLREVIEAELA